MVVPKESWFCHKLTVCSLRSPRRDMQKKNFISCARGSISWERDAITLMLTRVHEINFFLCMSLRGLCIVLWRNTEIIQNEIKPEPNLISFWMVSVFRQRTIQSRNRDMQKKKLSRAHELACECLLHWKRHVHDCLLVLTTLTQSCMWSFSSNCLYSALMCRGAAFCNTERLGGGGCDGIGLA